MSPQAAAAKVITLTQPDTTLVEQETGRVVAEAEALVIDGEDRHRLGLEILRRLATRARAIVELFKEPKAAAHQAHKAITLAERRLLEPNDKAKGIVSGKCNVFEQKRLAEAAQERRRREEEVRKQEEDRRAVDAAAATSAGDTDTAEAIAQTPIVAPVVTVEPAIAKVEGVSTVTRWSAEVVNKLALLKHIVANPEWIDLVEPNQKTLNRIAVSMKQNMNIPGVKAVPTQSKRVSG